MKELLENIDWTSELKKLNKKIKGKLKENPYLVDIEKICQTKNNIYIIQEYCSDGDLSTLKNLRKKQGIQFTEEECISILDNVIRALIMLH